MIRVYAVFDAPILLGRQGEHDMREVVFDISDWLNDYGEGYAQLAVHRHDEDEYYLVPLKTEGRTVVWKVTAPDVGVVGQNGECELSWYSNEGAFVKSQTWRTTVQAALNGKQVEAPGTTQAWLDSTREQAAKTQKAAEEAIAAADAAAKSKQAAEECALRAEAARDSIVLDEQKMAQAVEKAEEAAQSIPKFPEITEEDNGKFLRVVNGAWEVVAVGSAEEVEF